MAYTQKNSPFKQTKSHTTKEGDNYVTTTKSKGRFYQGVSPDLNFSMEMAKTRQIGSDSIQKVKVKPDTVKALETPAKQTKYVPSTVGRKYWGAAGAKKRQALQDKNRANRSLASALDITGFSNHDDADLGFENLVSMASEKDVKWDTSRALRDGLDIASAWPGGGTVRTGFNLVKSAAVRIGPALGKIAKNVGVNVVADDANKVMTKNKTNKKLTNKVK